MSLSTPVAFVVFNRPQLTEQSFARIRAQRPAQLFVVADGPRPDHPADVEQCEQVREVVADVDWPCTVHRDYADTNLGLKRRVSSGLDWVFSQVDRAIILEDDCIPNDDFFTFCELLLSRYADDERVAAVTGDNFQDGLHRGDGAYYFSKYPHCWGWATWRRSWQHYDGGIRFWPAWRGSAHWEALHPDPLERQYWEAILDRCHRGEIDTWDYPWTASVWRRNGLTATPNANLVTNTGFGPDATHTVTETPEVGRPATDLGLLTHPVNVDQDVEADRYTFEHHFGGATMRRRRRPIGYLRWVVGGVLRRVQRRLEASPNSD